MKKILLSLLLLAGIVVNGQPPSTRIIITQASPQSVNPFNFVFSDSLDNNRLYVARRSALLLPASQITGFNAAETDPTVPANVKAITATDISNWNTAFGWGNHATQGYVLGTRTLTINGVTQDLSLNRIWNVGTVTSVGLLTGTSGTDINISGSPITTNGDITINIPTASATNRGVLSTADWTTFNNKENALTFSAPLSRSVNTISIPVATGSVNGYLSSTDFNTFNNKVSATRAINTTSPLTGGGDLSADRTISIPAANGSTNGYLSSTDWTTFNNKQSALTFSTGLTNSSNTITNNLSLGVTGGQSMYGGLAASDNLVINSTNNITKGKIFFGTNSAYDEANIRLGIGVTSPTNDLEVGSTITGSHTIRVNAPFASTSNISWSQGSTTAWTMYRVASSADLRLNNSSSDVVSFSAGGNVGFGAGLINPTAAIHLRAGSSGAGTASFKITNSGSKLTVPETGAIEAQVDTLFYTIPSATTRKKFAFQEDLQGNLLATVSGINFNATGVTNLYTVPAGKKTIITAVIFTAQTATGVGTSPTVGIGIAAGEQDIYASTLLAGWNQTNELYKFSTNGTYIVGQSGEIIKLGIDNAANGTLTGTLKLFGYNE